MSLSLVSVNIEGSKHLDRVLGFLEVEMPDVLCVQELNQKDVVFFEATLSAKSFFVPMAIGSEGPYGIGIFARAHTHRQFSLQYGGQGGPLQKGNHENVDIEHETQQYSLAVCEVEKGGQQYTVATTHFPVTVKGEPTDFQRGDMRTLLEKVAEVGDVVLCGDFNAPRGGEVFSMLAATLTDNIPPQYKTSLDLELHRSGKVRPHELADKMVDGLFTSQRYRASNVSLRPGVSDHQAIVATINHKA